MSENNEGPKAKKLSAQEIKKLMINRIISEVEQLTRGQSLIYKLPESGWIMDSAFLIAELNPSYPEKGRKYVYSRDKIVDGKPSGQKIRAFESNKPIEFANWVVDRNGERYS